MTEHFIFKSQEYGHLSANKMLYFFKCILTLICFFSGRVNPYDVINSKRNFIRSGSIHCRAMLYNSNTNETRLPDNQILSQ